MKKLILLLPVFFVISCSGEAPDPAATVPADDLATTATAPGTDVEEAATPRPNILLIISDDMGLETLASFGVGSDTASTPNLDALAEGGMIFTNFWSQPICSPTRSTVLTGRYGFRTGIGGPTGDFMTMGPYPPPPEIPEGSPTETGTGPPLREYVEELTPEQDAEQFWGLGSDEYSLPQAFLANPDLGYRTAAIGKWHLADRKNGWLDHPARVGFDHFDGSIRGYPDSYFAWNQITNGEVRPRTGYGPTAKVDDALDWIGMQDNPWFMWFALNLPHRPLHRPPVELLNTQALKDLDPYGDAEENPLAYFQAMIEAMDTEIGRLLSSMSPEVRANTYVIFIGDNGTDRREITAPYNRVSSKGSVFEGGVNVPMIIAGPGIPPGSKSEGLVNSVDLFITIMEMAGIDPAATIPNDVRHDSVSFLPYLQEPEQPSIREWIYADYLFLTFRDPDFVPLGIEDRKALRNATHKLVMLDDKPQLYDIIDDPYESNDLLSSDERSDDVEAAYQQLNAQLQALLATE